MIFHLISYVSWGVGILVCLVVGRYSHKSGFSEAKKLNRPVNRFEVLTIPTNHELSVVPGHKLDAVGKFVQRQVEKSGMVLCTGQSQDGYQIIIRNTVEVWGKRSGYNGTYWNSFSNSTDTLIGFVAASDPEFHTKILKLQDEAMSKAVVLESIA
jgi:hypothetical protein